MGSFGNISLLQDTNIKNDNLNIINRIPELTNDKHQYFSIKVRNFNTLGKDIQKLIQDENLYFKIFYIQIERKE